MSAIEISLTHFAGTIVSKFRHEDEADMHPAEMATIEGWLNRMFTAAEMQQPLEVARLARMLDAKVAQERELARKTTRNAVIMVFIMW